MIRRSSSRGLGLALASIVLAASFVGCPLLKKKPVIEDDEDDASVLADAATVSVTGIGAKNEVSVLRYANETPLPNEPALIGAEGAKARNFPGNGPEVATLPKGTPVAKIAQYFSTGVLIMFDDPSGDGTKLIGWVSPKVFDVAAPAPTKAIIVPPRVDAGATPKVEPKDAGASPATVDASAAPTKDAGTTPIADAGSKGGLPQPSKGSLAVAPVDGKCPDGWIVNQGMCRRKCTADTECPPRIKCISKGGTKVCTSDH